eukprot:895160-Amphidinium_carterae.1
MQQHVGPGRGRKGARSMVRNAKSLVGGLVDEMALTTDLNSCAHIMLRKVPRAQKAGTFQSSSNESKLERNEVSEKQHT